MLRLRCRFSPVSTVVKNFTHNPEIEGSNLEIKCGKVFFTFYFILKLKLVKNRIQPSLIKGLLEEAIVTNLKSLKIIAFFSSKDQFDKTLYACN